MTKLFPVQHSVKPIWLSSSPGSAQLNQYDLALPRTALSYTNMTMLFSGQRSVKPIWLSSSPASVQLNQYDLALPRTALSYTNMTMLFSGQRSVKPIWLSSSPASVALPQLSTVLDKYVETITNVDTRCCIFCLRCLQDTRNLHKNMSWMISGTHTVSLSRKKELKVLSILRRNKKFLITLAHF